MSGVQASPIFSTFRDPAGSVQVRADGVYRQVRPPYDVEILSFLDTPLAAGLVQEGRLISSEVLVGGEGDEALVLRHPRVGFPSYPWEWPPAMWLSAAELTLSLCRDLVQNGWILKDATPLNVLFHRARPVFVDVLSIQRADLDRPIWQAYGQFVRTFVLPLLANAKLGWPLQAAILNRDGYSPDEVFAALPWHLRIRQPALSTVNSAPNTLSRWRRRGLQNRPVLRSRTGDLATDHSQESGYPAASRPCRRSPACEVQLDGVCGNSQPLQR